MGLIEKFEELFNKIIFTLFELLSKNIPLPIKVILQKIKNYNLEFKLFLKGLPKKLKEMITVFISFIRNIFKSEKMKPSFSMSYRNLIKNINEQNPQRGLLKNVIFLPLTIFSFLSKGLSYFHILVLMIFTTGSVISIFAINNSTQSLIKKYTQLRMPASLEEEAIYDRPEYYKKELRHVEITNLRLPVFFSQLNELKTVDIDFMITTSNRFSKTFIHKHDLHLRDHLLIHLEPILPSLPLDDEGKEIIRKKLISETDEFLKKHKVEGHVIDLKITYILAN
jgi:hypothetical protein